MAKPPTTARPQRPATDVTRDQIAKTRAAQQARVAESNTPKVGEGRTAAKTLDKGEKAAKPAKSDARGGYREPHGRDSRGHGGHSGSLRHLGDSGRDGSVAGAEHHGYKHTSEDR